jgi:periplasmic protein CpxP/Spy
MMAASLLMATSLFTPQTFAGRGERGHWREKFVERLNLDEKQKVQFREMSLKMKAEMKGLRQEQKALREKMGAAFEANESDEVLKALNGQLQNLRAKISEKRFEKMLGIRKILTDEQRKIFKQTKPDRIRAGRCEEEKEQ